MTEPKTTSSCSLYLPSIDIAPFVRSQSSDKDRLQVLKEVRKSCLDHGFFIATGHGVPRDLQQRVLDQSQLLFGLPIEEKIKLSEDKSFGRSHRGYQAVKGERLQQGQAPDLKEGFQMGVEKSTRHQDCIAQRMLTGPNVWAPSLEPYFSTVMKEYFQQMCNLQDILMRIIAQTLCIDYDKTFKAFCADSLRGLRLLHYPPQRRETDLGAGAHTDFGALTILLTDGVSGLQVLDNDEKWMNINTTPGAYVVNLGDMMKRMTDGLYKSSIHRVVNTSGKHRYSAPMFLDGNLDYIIAPLVNSQAPTTLIKLTVEEHMMERFGNARDYVKKGISSGA